MRDRKLVWRPGAGRQSARSPTRLSLSSNYGALPCVEDQEDGIGPQLPSERMAWRLTLFTKSGKGALLAYQAQEGTVLRLADLTCLSVSIRQQGNQ